MAHVHPLTYTGPETSKYAAIVPLLENPILMWFLNGGYLLLEVGTAMVKANFI